VESRRSFPQAARDDSSDRGQASGLAGQTVSQLGGALGSAVPGAAAASARSRLVPLGVSVWKSTAARAHLLHHCRRLIVSDNLHLLPGCSFCAWLLST
jgi:hypothetical protein